MSFLQPIHVTLALLFFLFFCLFRFSAKSPGECRFLFRVMWVFSVVKVAGRWFFGFVFPTVFFCLLAFACISAFRFDVDAVAVCTFVCVGRRCDMTRQNRHASTSPLFAHCVMVYCLFVFILFYFFLVFFYVRIERVWLLRSVCSSTLVFVLAFYRASLDRSCRSAAVVSFHKRSFLLTLSVLRVPSRPSGPS